MHNNDDLSIISEIGGLGQSVAKYFKNEKVLQLMRRLGLVKHDLSRNTNVAKKICNLSRDEPKALKSFKQRLSIVITRADNGNATTMKMGRSLYNS
ncbi:hypothetical protein GJ496_008320 [Pomphorhynchus laevis]|nr:hypothetical protein GJ496_008320 [Pomphorhynchus laevis]